MLQNFLVSLAPWIIGGVLGAIVCAVLYGKLLIPSNGDKTYARINLFIFISVFLISGFLLGLNQEAGTLLDTAYFNYGPELEQLADLSGLDEEGLAVADLDNFLEDVQVQIHELGSIHGSEFIENILSSVLNSFRYSLDSEGFFDKEYITLEDLYLRLKVYALEKLHFLVFWIEFGLALVLLALMAILKITVTSESKQLEHKEKAVQEKKILL